MTQRKDFGSKYYATSDGKIFTNKQVIEISNQTGKTGKFKTIPERELRVG